MIDPRTARRADPRYVLCPACAGHPHGCAHCAFWGTVLRDSPDARCVHVWRSERIASCLHRRTCTLCGTTDTLDTSG